MKSLVHALLLVGSIAFVSSMAVAAEDEPKKEVPKKEVPKKEKKPATTIEWTEVKTDSGVLKKPEYKKGQAQKKAEPTAVEFDVESQGFRVRIKAEQDGDEKGGSLRATMLKKEGSGEKAKYRSVGNLGSARAGSEIGKVFTGAGSYKIELEGDKVKYEVVVEAAEKKSAESGEKNADK